MSNKVSFFIAVDMFLSRRSTLALNLRHDGFVMVQVVDVLVLREFLAKIHLVIVDESSHCTMEIHTAFPVVETFGFTLGWKIA